MTPEPLVLAVDDEAGILRLMKLELTGQGFRVITASTVKRRSRSSRSSGRTSSFST